MNAVREQVFEEEIDVCLLVVHFGNTVSIEVVVVDTIIERFM